MIVDQEAVVTSPVALSTSQATLATSAVPTPSPVNPGQAGVYGIARAQLPLFTAVPAGATVIVSILRGDTGAAIGQTQFVNTGASSASISGGSVTAVIPEGVSQVQLAAQSSSGTPSAYAAANSPILLEVDLNLGIG